LAFLSGHVFLSTFINFAAKYMSNHCTYCVFAYLRAAVARKRSINIGKVL